MTSLTKRLLAATLGLVLTFALGACDGDDDPTTTTAPNGTDTTAPVGS